MEGVFCLVAGRIADYVNKEVQIGMMVEMVTRKFSTDMDGRGIIVYG